MLDSFHLLIGINVKMKWRNSVWHLYESSNLEIFEEVAWDGTTHFLTFISLTLCFCWCFEAIFFWLVMWKQGKNGVKKEGQVPQHKPGFCLNSQGFRDLHGKTCLFAAWNCGGSQPRSNRTELAIRDLRAADFWAPPLHLPIEQW